MRQNILNWNCFFECFQAVIALVQRANATGWAHIGSGHQEFAFEKYILTAELSADEMLSITESKTIPGKPLP